jgi:geranylgeranyl transferase type-1 subunit beta
MELNVDALAAHLAISIDAFPSDIQYREIELSNIAHFCLNGLAIIGRLDTVLTPQRKTEVIDWIYSNQTTSPEVGGFRHSPCHFTPRRTIEQSHIMMTYSSLAMLLLLGDDLKRVDVPRVLSGLVALQLPNGGFRQTPFGSEYDLRFSFCAAAITAILGSTGDVDVENAVRFVLSCQTYEGGFSQVPLDEAHGGSTFCAIAALDLWGALGRIRDRRMLAYWLSQRQSDGFNGRSHKLSDVCYSYWVGASITIMGWFDDIVSKESLTAFIFSNYCETGQLRANSAAEPDLLHTHFALAGLSLLRHPGVDAIHPSLGFVRKCLPDRILNRTRDSGLALHSSAF